MRAALATLVLIAAGCGGKDSLSRAEWAAQATRDPWQAPSQT